MTATLKELGIDRLGFSERLSLVHAIWDSLADFDSRPPLTDEFRNELDRRLEDHIQNPADAIPWEQVKAEALARLAK